MFDPTKPKYGATGLAAGAQPESLFRTPGAAKTDPGKFRTGSDLSAASKFFFRMLPGAGPAAVADRNEHPPLSAGYRHPQPPGRGGGEGLGTRPDRTGKTAGTVLPPDPPLRHGIHRPVPGSGIWGSLPDSGPAMQQPMRPDRPTPWPGGERTWHKLSIRSEESGVFAGWMRLALQKGRALRHALDVIIFFAALRQWGH